MSDSDIQALERAHREAPEDDVILERLELEWLRHNLGWFGEELPAKLYPTERHRYEFAVDCGEREPELGIEMVYVPGREVECGHEGAPEWRTPPHPMAAWCPHCRGSGHRKAAPFYLGRFPVTRREWWVSKESDAEMRAYAAAQKAGGPYHPVENVSITAARVFCSWAGLRLPTEQEWRWAALGGEAQFVACAGCGATPSEPKDGCRWDPRRYPWGNDPPSPERCVWAGHPEFGPYTPSRGDAPRQIIRSLERPGSTAPVVVRTWDHAPGRCGPMHSGCERLVPARPLGASWCGAHDMAGNVWEWTSDRSALGGSFRANLQEGGALAFSGHPMGWEPEARDDVGFRVAISAPS